MSKGQFTVVLRGKLPGLRQREEGMAVSLEVHGMWLLVSTALVSLSL